MADGAWGQDAFGFSPGEWTAIALSRRVGVGAAMAAAIMGFQLMVRAIQLSIEAIDPGRLDAARTLAAPECTCSLRSRFRVPRPHVRSVSRSRDTPSQLAGSPRA